MVISQSLCDVCAVPVGDVREAVLTLESQPVLVDMAPNGLDDVPVCFDQAGAAIGRVKEAGALIRQWHDTFESYRGVHADKDLEIAFLDWMNPPFIAGHWVPEMVELLGLTNCHGQAREPSFKVTWEAINAAQPDLLVSACCGFGVAQAEREAAHVACTVIHLDGHLRFSAAQPRQAGPRYENHFPTHPFCA